MIYRIEIDEILSDGVLKFKPNRSRMAIWIRELIQEAVVSSRVRKSTGSTGVGLVEFGLCTQKHDVAGCFLDRQ